MERQSQYQYSDHPIWNLYSTANTFVISPKTSFSVNKSLIIDKQTTKIVESDLIHRDDADTITEILGFVGILNVLGIDHLMVVTQREEVCRFYHKYQYSPQDPSSIFELLAVDLIPFMHVPNPQREQQLKIIREGIMRFLENGFYLSYRFDLTSNAQRRERLLSQQEQTNNGQPVEPLASIDCRYMWNYNLYKQLRAQNVPEHWMIPMIQGYVGHTREHFKGADLELILVARRRWEMGGTRYNARGIDEKGNVGNYVETEQLIFKHVYKDEYNRVYLYSFSEIRGSIPVYWRQDGVKARITLSRALESSEDAFLKHCESIFADYNNQSFVMVNLLNQAKPEEELLRQGLEGMLANTKDFLESAGKKVDYEYFDFHANCKKGSTSLCDELVRGMYKKLYLRDMGVYSEKSTNHLLQGKIVKRTHKTLSYQRGVVRTNCLDCLDRTNVFQSKVCLAALEDHLQEEIANEKIATLLINLWAMAGDIISKIYAGTASVLTSITLKGNQNMLDKIDHGYLTMKRFFKQNLSDDFKQECIMVIQGQHPLCNSATSNFVESVIFKEIDTYSEYQKIVIHVSTLNCCGKQPKDYQELIPIFKPVIEGVQPDIYVVGLQEIVQLNMLNVLKGKNRTSIKEWEMLLSNAILAVSDSASKNHQEKYVFVIAKSMVGCFIGLFVKAKILSRMRELKTTKIKTGMGGGAGNKGAVILRFRLDDTNVMLMNCHLMSGRNKGLKRTEELNMVFENAFKTEEYNRLLQKYCVENHEIVYIFGDLNYRINQGNEVVRSACEQGQMEMLKEHDELMLAFKYFKNSIDPLHYLYHEYTEGPISFPPTYKYDRYSCKYDSSKKQRVPSWCDRILWKENPKVSLQHQDSVQSVLFSDHKPVFAQFEVFTQKLIQEKTQSLMQNFYDKMRFQSVAVNKNIQGKSRSVASSADFGLMAELNKKTGTDYQAMHTDNMFDILDQKEASRSTLQAPPERQLQIANREKQVSGEVELEFDNENQVEIELDYEEQKMSMMEEQFLIPEMDLTKNSEPLIEENDDDSQGETPPKKGFFQSLLRPK